MRCDLATAPTAEAAELLRESAQKPFRRPIEVVPNGIAVDRFRPNVPVPDWRARCGLPNGPVLAYLGRLTEDKGIHRFLDAVEELAAERPVTALVGGVGPEEAAVRARLGKGRLAGIARYVGPVSEEEKPSFLAQSDLFVLPSVSDTASVAALEAMASGATCVTSDHGGLPDVVRDGITGRIAPLDPPGALPRVLGELLDDPAERTRLARNARDWVVRSASLEAMARRFISLYELVLAERGAHDRNGARGAAGARPT